MSDRIQQFLREAQERTPVVGDYIESGWLENDDLTRALRMVQAAYARHGNVEGFCYECGTAYPCVTIQDIEQAMDAEPKETPQ